MKKQHFPALLILSLIFMVTGCGKESTPAQPTKTDYITQASWKFDHATASGIDISSQINACFKDNIATFTSSGNMTLDEGANVCSPTSYAGSYTWAFQSNETMLHLNNPIFPGGSNDFTLVSVNGTNLVVSQMMTVAPNPPTNVEVTFKH